MQITKSFECSYFFFVHFNFPFDPKASSFDKEKQKKTKKNTDIITNIHFRFFFFTVFFIFVSLLSDKMVEFFGFQKERERDKTTHWVIGFSFFSLSFSLVIRIRGGFSYEQKKNWKLLSSSSMMMVVMSMMRIFYIQKKRNYHHHHHTHVHDQT